MIKILSDEVSNRIAAGEVVERPASVVKELVENSLDAGAKRIRIEIKKGGRSLIRVFDDGCGMARDDALLCIERYATSKIKEAKDLFSIKTMGFRGEALPSIASVSFFRLVTKDEKSLAGVEIRMEGGRIKSVTETGAPRGTMVEVSRLFFNTPARRKFLKSDATEFAHIADLVTDVAVAWPEVGFILEHNGRVIKDWPAVEDPAERVAGVIGKGARLLPILTEEGPVSVRGWVADPSLSRSTPKQVRVYVNKRAVRSRLIYSALLKGFETRLMKGRYPLAVIFIRVPPEKVDVNVHPAKQEVRFSDPGAIHGAVVRSVIEAFSAAGPGAMKPPRVMEKRIEYAAQGSGDSCLRPASVPSRKKPPEQARIQKEGFFSSLTVIGQLRFSYILCESDEGLVILDQHAAHERVLFEELSGTIPKKGQRLLVPVPLHLGFKEADLARRILKELERAGFVLEEFGSGSFVIRQVPQVLAQRDVAALLGESLEAASLLDLAALDSGLIFAEVVKRLACHRALKAKSDLALPGIKELLAMLDKCKNPETCPHGRPVTITFKISEIERMFKRVS